MFDGYWAHYGSIGTIWGHQGVRKTISELFCLGFYIPKMHIKASIYDFRFKIGIGRLVYMILDQVSALMPSVPPILPPIEVSINDLIVTNVFLLMRRNVCMSDAPPPSPTYSAFKCKRLWDNIYGNPIIRDDTMPIVLPPSRVESPCQWWVTVSYHWIARDATTECARIHPGTAECADIPIQKVLFWI